MLQKIIGPYLFEDFYSLRRYTFGYSLKFSLSGLDNAKNWVVILEICPNFFFVSEISNSIYQEKYNSLWFDK